MSRIWNITPYDPQKRLGKIHNDFCALIPLDDFILITDPDMMFLLPQQMNWIEDIVAMYGHRIDVFGCMTNRIGVEAQIYKSQIPVNLYVDGESIGVGLHSQSHFDETDITEHIGLAHECYEKHKYTIEETNLVAGFMMVFKKSLWNKIKFQEGINFDVKFCEAVKKQGGIIAIMKGVYCLHLYRWGKENPKSYKQHLLNK